MSRGVSRAILHRLTPEYRNSPISTLVVKRDSIEAAYDFQVKGHKASSRISGTRTGETLSGTFETLYKGKVVDTGTSKTIRKK